LKGKFAQDFFLGKKSRFAKRTICSQSGQFRVSR
jgi:hypothetical protein